MFNRLKKVLALGLATAMLVTLVPSELVLAAENTDTEEIEEESEDLNEDSAEEEVIEATTAPIMCSLWGSDYVKVSVYASDGTDTSLKTNTDICNLLGISYVQDDDFAPIGVISLPKSFFKNKNSTALINSQDDWNTVYNAISSIDTSKLINQGEVNKNNKVFENLDKVSVDYGKVKGSQYTALFAWSGSEHADNSSEVVAVYGKNSTAISGTYNYHLDLRFETKSITYVGVYTSGGKTTEVQMGSRTFLKNTATIEPKEAGDWYLDTTNIPSGYVIDGYYSDKALSSTYTFGSNITENTTVYVKLTKSDLSVTFDLDGGSSTTSKLTYSDLKLGSETPSVTTPSKAGYTFAGWEAYDSDGNLVGTYEEDEIPSYVTSTVTYKAVWTPAVVTYKVIVETEQLDGSYKTSTSTYEATTGENVSYTESTPEGFTKDSSSVTEATVAADGSTELTVKYNRNTYTVSYAYTNETLPKHYSSLPASKTYKYGETVVTATAASATGYTFSGWDHGTSFSMPAYDVTIKGSFTASGETSYKVEHYIEDLDGEGYTLYKTENLTGDADTTAYANAITITGFTYDENNTENVKSGTIDVDKVLVLKLYYTRNTYTIKYSYDGYVPADATSLSGLKTEYKYGEKVEAEDSKAAGYDFSGWSRNNFTIGEDDDSVIEIKGSFTARKDTQYKVNYYFENVDDSDYTLSTAKSYTGTATTGSTVTISDIPEIKGFTFDEDNENNVLSGTVAGDGSLVLNIYYTRNTYSVTYSLAENSSAEDTELPAGSTTVKYGATVNVDDATEVEGYEFSGWSVSDSDGDKLSSTSFTMPAADVTIEGYYEPKDGTKYTVKYYLEDLSDDSSADATYTLKDTKTYTGVTDSEVNAAELKYAGFTLDKTIKGTVASGTIKNDGSLVLSLYYSRNTYTVTYQYDGTKTATTAASLPDEKSYKYGSLVSIASYPEEAGYTFKGWSKSGDFTIKEDTVITGYFTANTNTQYTVEYYLEPLSGSDYEVSSETYTATTGTAVSATAKDFTGFTYDSSNENNVTSGIVAGDGSLTLTFYYTRNTYTVNYAITGLVVPEGISSKIPASATYKYGQTVSVEKAIETAGYTFNGWSRSEDFEMPANDVTITGSFEISGDTQYTVKYYQMNTEGSDYDLIDTITGTGYTLTECTANEKAYDGFTINRAKSTLSGTIAADGSTVLEVYYDRNKYELTYAYSGAVPSDATSLPVSQEIYYGAEITLAEDATAAGYTFNGWNLSVDYKNSDGKNIMPSSSVVVTGYFTANENTKYTVEHYKENLDGSYSIAETEELEGTTDTIANAIIKTNYSNFVHNDNDNDVLSGTVAGDGSLVLKVYYDRVYYSVSYQYDGNVPSDATKCPTTIYYKYGTTVELAADATAAGYTFSGWGIKDTTFTAEADVTFHGNFTANGNTTYVVNHYLEGLDGEYTLAETQTLTAETDSLVTPVPNVYAGYTYDGNTESATISGKGNTVFNLYYTLNTHTVTVQYRNAAGSTIAATAKLNVKYGDSFIIYSPDISGYKARYSSVVSPDGGMPDYDINVTVYYDTVSSGSDDDDDSDDSSTDDTDDGNDDNQDDGRTPTTPGTVVDPTDPIPEAEIIDESVPTGQITLSDDGDANIVTIEDADTALFGGKASGWALLNLIAMVIGAVYAVYMLILMFRRNKKKDEDEEAESAEEDDEEEEKRDKKMLKLLSILAGVLSVIVFILTENIKNPMVIVDSWTVFMFILLVVELLLAFFSRRKKQDKDDEQKETTK